MRGRAYLAAMYALECYLAPILRGEDMTKQSHLAGMSGGPTTYLAGVHAEEKRAGLEIDWFKHLNMLESFYYINKWQVRLIHGKKIKRFMLDSGAYTFMEQGKKNIDWLDYTMQYVDFINKNNVELFFELDIDSIVGIKKVEELRGIIEKETGKKCIPVWHKSRGKQYFLDMIDEYSYVSIGGIAGGEIRKKDYPFFHWFINKAHEKGVKIHALGFSGLTQIMKYDFDSIDSSSWLFGHCSRFLYRFTGSTLIKIKLDGGKKINMKAVCQNNFIEWVKFSRWLEHGNS